MQHRDETAVSQPEGACLSPRAERKLAQVLEGARAVIVAKGLGNASVDDIAREAGISKATMYRYFPDKAALFEALMQRDCARQSCALAAIEACERPVRETLVDFAIGFTAFILSDFAQELYRTAVSEAPRFPQVARSFHSTRVEQPRLALRRLLELSVARGELAIDDLDLAADRFFGLCKAGVFCRRLFEVETRFEEAEIAAHARSAVEAFRRIYSV